MEIKTTIDEVAEILDIVRNVNEKIDTVTAVGVSTRCDEKGEDNVLATALNELGYSYTRAKTNLGLGKVTNNINFEPNTETSAL